MSDDGLLTPQQVVRQLTKLGNELDVTVRMLKEAEEDAVVKRHAADMAESRAFVSAEGSMDMRKHLARIAAGQHEQDALVAEALVRHLRNTVRAIDTRIEIGRSYGAAVRSELKMLPYSEQP